jgi:hypothetical protein
LFDRLANLRQGINAASAFNNGEEMTGTNKYVVKIEWNCSNATDLANIIFCHEFTHFLCHEKWSQLGLAKRKILDGDLDGVPDKWEDKVGLDRFKKNTYRHFSGSISSNLGRLVGRDFEFYAWINATHCNQENGWTSKYPESTIIGKYLFKKPGSTEFAYMDSDRYIKDCIPKGSNDKFDWSEDGSNWVGD